VSENIAEKIISEYFFLASCLWLLVIISEEEQKTIIYLEQGNKKRISNRQDRHRPVARPLGETGSRLCIEEFLKCWERKRDKWNTMNG
jgi:hypothetical protein